MELQDQVDAFLALAPFAWDYPSHQTAGLNLPHDAMDLQSDGSDGLLDYPDSEDDSDDQDAHIGLNPEKSYLPLPSTLGIHHFSNPLVAALAEDEVHLRVTQASEALQQLRLSLGLKSALFRNSVALAKSQRTKSRAWRSVKVVEASVRRHSQEYCNARQALVHLHASSSVMDKFPILKKEDLKMSRDVVEENRVGQRSEHVSWIWRLDAGSAIGQNALLQESECVH
jgi:hypothetical protein